MAKAVRSLPPGQTTTDADPWSKYLARFRTCPNESYSAGYPTRRPSRNTRATCDSSASCCWMPTSGISTGAPPPVPVRSASSWPGFPSPARCCWPLGGAIACRVNLPLSVALVWLSNPLTMPPLFYGAYLVGCQLLGQRLPAHRDHLHLGLAGVGVRDGGPAALLGSLVLALLSALVGYLLVRAGWRLSTVRQWQKRKVARPC